MQNFNLMNAEQIAEKFASLAASTTEPTIDEAREAELMKLTKQELVSMILVHEAPKAAKTTNVQDIAKAILQSEECLACNYEEIAGACRILIPGAQTSAKSIASYVSKKRTEWALPDRILVRSQKPQAPVDQAPVDQAHVEEAPEPEAE